MATSTQLSRVTPYVARLLDDDYVQDQLAAGLSSLRQSAKRARAQRANQALNDQRLRRQIGTSVQSFTNAISALRQPPPKGHPVRRAVLLLAGAAAGIAAGQALRSKSGGSGG